ncbi:MAG TPA: uroporphyrinogen-III synthase [Sphingomicrobium sp.]|jgi:uroporphyrinogen-III synthase
MSRVLVLRPEPGASATVAKAREQGLDAAAVPLFEVEPIDWEAPEPSNFDGVLFTSANAVRHGGDKLKDYRGLQAYAVGQATADEARDAGFGIASVGNSGVARLLHSIDADLRLLHLCGEDRRDPEGAKQEITTVAVYRSKPIEAPDLSCANGAVALIHSPRAGARFAELITEKGQTSIAAISEAAAEAAGDGWARVEAAPEPTDDALLALAARLCNKPVL